MHLEKTYHLNRVEACSLVVLSLPSPPPISGSLSVLHNTLYPLNITPPPQQPSEFDTGGLTPRSLLCLAYCIYHDVLQVHRVHHVLAFYSFFARHVLLVPSSVAGAPGSLCYWLLQICCCEDGCINVSLSLCIQCICVCTQKGNCCVAW